MRRDDAERFIEEVRGDDPEAVAKLRIAERELEVGGLNKRLRAITASSPEREVA